MHEIISQIHGVLTVPEIDRIRAPGTQGIDRPILCKFEEQNLERAKRRGVERLGKTIQNANKK